MPLARPHASLCHFSCCMQNDPFSRVQMLENIDVFRSVGIPSDWVSVSSSQPCSPWVQP